MSKFIVQLNRNQNLLYEVEAENKVEAGEKALARYVNGEEPEHSLFHPDAEYDEECDIFEQ
jgi:hypothetical protein